MLQRLRAVVYTDYVIQYTVDIRRRITAPVFNNSDIGRWRMGADVRRQVRLYVRWRMCIDVRRHTSGMHRCGRAHRHTCAGACA